ncbi:PR domain zinc finger protein 16, partial [Tolypocladium ophioglossoides CBS 100239]
VSTSAQAAAFALVFFPPPLSDRTETTFSVPPSQLLRYHRAKEDPPSIPPPTSWDDSATSSVALVARPSQLEARENHCNATGHSEPDFECDSCPRWFNSKKALEQHMDATDHWSFECACCDENWSTEEECTEHEHNDHLYCSDCNRFFQHWSNLQQHLNSRAHRSYRVECPFCRSGCSTAGGLTHHLESGGCPDAPRLNRDQIYKLVRSKDPNGLISKNLIGWTGSCRYEATGKTWKCVRMLPVPSHVPPTIRSQPTSGVADALCTIVPTGLAAWTSRALVASSTTSKAKLAVAPDSRWSRERLVTISLATVISASESACHWERSGSTTFSGVRIRDSDSNKEATLITARLILPTRLGPAAA